MKDIKRVFADLEQCQTLSQLDHLMELYDYKNGIQKYYNKYPRKNLTLSKIEIEGLKESGIISKETNHINLCKIPDDQPLAKLLILLIWKNGDTNHIQHLVDGMMGERKSISKQNLIFRQYGKSLADVHEPIVDQHVLRAFRLKSVSDDKEFLRIRKKSVYKNTDEHIVEAYKEWFQNLLKKVLKKDKSKFRDKVDLLLFMVGKENAWKKKEKSNNIDSA